MRVDVFFVLRPSGGFVAQCTAFPGWRFAVDKDDRISRRAAEHALREYVASDLEVRKWEVPLANEPLAVAA